MLASPRLCKQVSTPVLVCFVQSFLAVEERHANSGQCSTEVHERAVIDWEDLCCSCELRTHEKQSCWQSLRHHSAATSELHSRIAYTQRTSAASLLCTYFWVKILWQASIAWQANGMRPDKTVRAEVLSSTRSQQTAPADALPTSHLLDSRAQCGLTETSQFQEAARLRGR